MSAPTRSPGDVISLPDTAATESAGQALGRALETELEPRPAGGALIVGLAGGLGAGKTTMARAALRALGVAGTVRSPTYTIAEPYETRIGRMWHLDLYRIADPEELEYIAIRDLVSESAACLVEWPERGRGGFPEPDCLVTLDRAGPGVELGAGPGAGLGAGPGAGLGAGPGAGLGAGPGAGLGAGLGRRLRIESRSAPGDAVGSRVLALMA